MLGIITPSAVNFAFSSAVTFFPLLCTLSAELSFLPAYHPYLVQRASDCFLVTDLCAVYPCMSPFSGVGHAHKTDIALFDPDLSF